MFNLNRLLDRNRWLNFWLGVRSWFILAARTVVRLGDIRLVGFGCRNTACTVVLFAVDGFLNLGDS